MKRDAIIKTGVCYWSDNDNCFVVESPLFSRTAGVGDTQEQAWTHFQVMVDEALQDIRAHGLYQFPGRPAKGIVSINVQVKPETRDAIKQLQSELATSSQGEVLDYVLFLHQSLKTAPPRLSGRGGKQDGQTQSPYPRTAGGKGQPQAVAEIAAQYGHGGKITLESLARRIEMLEAALGARQREE